MDNICDKKIILDSCILIYFEEDEGNTKNLINLLKNNNNTILISDISAFEIFKNRQTKDNIKSYETLLNSLQGIPVDRPVIINAATLYYLYKKQKNNNEENIMDPKDRLTGDLIIGGTVISYQNHLLLTSNKKDFPLPYWQAIAESEVGKERAIKVYLLEPNMDIIKSDIPIKDPMNWPRTERAYKFRG